MLFQGDSYVINQSITSQSNGDARAINLASSGSSLLSYSPLPLHPSSISVSAIHRSAKGVGTRTTSTRFLGVSPAPPFVDSLSWLSCVCCTVLSHAASFPIRN
jgi:hypothetical protein